MPTIDKIPAAQYVRISTDHQQYSLENQTAVIETYAQLHGFQVVCTYTDAAKSGVVLKHRSGLQCLLADVVSGGQPFRAILVYDVSRWGRFQDTDEAAHYEFLCKSAGVPVHYCAETFPNDGTIPSSIMKALKRAMASEYSRELGTKVLAGQKRLASLGFKLGGPPGYGLRRMLVSPSRTPKQLLGFGERKSIAADRVILVPGPSDEVRCVKDIFTMFVSEKRSIRSIARDLNKRGIPHFDSAWDYQAVWGILRHPKYAGCSVFARSASKLYSPSVRLPKSEWVITPNAFQPLVNIETFNEAQKFLAARTIHLTDDELLTRLRQLLAIKGKLTPQLIHEWPNTPSPSTYRRRFGSLRRAYELADYSNPDQFKHMPLRRRTMALRDELFNRIVSIFPAEASIVKKNERWRSRLQLSNGTVVSVLIAPSLKTSRNHLHWQVDPHPGERHNATLLARLNKNNDAISDLHVFPCMRGSRFRLSLRDPWLKSGVKLHRLEHLFRALKKIERQYYRKGFL
jgi:DNA invertase Pin-like site-specific DNA recombinase